LSGDIPFPNVVLNHPAQLWLENGAQLAWLVDPIDANMTIYRPVERLGHAPETLDRPQSVAATDPVAGFALDCALLRS
jgi:Uma2 family endonuclease